MSFYNVAPEHCKAIASFTFSEKDEVECDTSSPHHQQQQHTGHNQNYNKKKKHNINGPRSNVSKNVQFVDFVVRLLEKDFYNYAMSQKEEPKEEDEPHDLKFSNNNNNNNKCDTDNVPQERPLPFPSPFLYTPAELVRQQDEWHRSNNNNNNNKERLRRTLPPPPPAYLLGNNKYSNNVSEINQDLLLKNGAAPMYELDLKFSPLAVSQTHVVLQGEAGLAVYTNFAPSGDKHKSDSANNLFLLSPDATSCVLVACRVRLHPSWKAKEVPANNNNDNNNNDRNNDNDVSSCDQLFLDRLQSTVTAAMVHLDREGDEGDEGDEDSNTTADSMLRKLCWRAAVPAWLHAVGRHFCEAYHTSAADSKHESEIETVRAALQRVEQLMVFGTSGEAAPSAGASSDVPAWLHIEWFVVGGVRMEKHAGPVLAQVLKALFNNRHPGEDEADYYYDGDDRKREKINTVDRPPLLANQIYLEDVLSHENRSNNNNNSDQDKNSKMALHVQHRLSEEGCCFWTFNTYLKEIQTEEAYNNSCSKQVRRRYACSASYGLLLQVNDDGGVDYKNDNNNNNRKNSGRCWPAQVLPKKRGYPASVFRGCLCANYRFLCPLEEKEAKASHSGANNNNNNNDNKNTINNNNIDALQVVVNTVASEGARQQILKSKSLFLKLPLVCSDDHANENTQQPQQQQQLQHQRRRLTLKDYVYLFLDAVHQNQNFVEAQRQNNSNDNNNNNAYINALSILPFLLLKSNRNYTSFNPQQKSKHENSDNDRNARGKTRRYHRTEWQVINPADVMDIDQVPDRSMLSMSTTPHCEPPDFPASTREKLKLQATFCAEDFFVYADDGNGDGSNNRDAGEEEETGTEGDVDGILFM